jgi:hypothetical protein
MAYKPRILNVADGGSGRSSATAYAVKCGGTTATGAEQSIASVGTAGQVLTSNGAGALPTMQTLPSSLSSFSAYLASTQNNVTGDGTIYTLGTGATLTILDNTGSNFTTSGVYTAPATGLYFLSVTCRIDGLTVSNTQSRLDIVTTGRTFLGNTIGSGARTAANAIQMQNCQLVQMNATDTATFQVSANGSTLTVDVAGTGGSGELTYMCGFRVA